MTNPWLVPSTQPAFSKFPARVVQKPTKRKQEHRKIEPSYVESCLIQLCRAERWAEVIYRCKHYPQEACLVPLHNDIPSKNNPFYRHSTKRALIEPFDGDYYLATVFRESALGIVCASKDIESDDAKCAILALIDANPRQISASQYIPGHTPLRDVILNDSCAPEIFGIMTEATSTYRGGELALQIKDKDGLTPIDHLVTLVQLGSSMHSIDMLEAFLRVKSETMSCIQDHHTSPLIRLLTMGNSFNNSPSTSNKKNPTYQWKRQNPNSDDLRSERVLGATKLLLDDDPTLLFQCSRVTECTPLHVALRNYGNYEPLIQELLKRDTGNEMIRVRNLYGDLPIHVACSVGVPLQILRLVVERTASASISKSMQEGIRRPCSAAERDPLIWSANKSGYTPVDLEWVRHIESGNGFYTARPFYPLEATGVRRHCFKQDEYYRELLKESVDQVMENYSPDDEGENSESDSREEEAKAIFGCLLDRISLVIRAAATSGFALDSNGALPAKLNESCTLGTPYSPTLPLPILELFLWLRPEEVMEKDQRDMLPIHHALRYSKTLSRDSCTHSSPNAIQDWRSFVFQLLQKSPEQCKAKCQDGRLPLHYLLDHTSNYGENDSRISGIASNEIEKLQRSRHTIVEKLVELYPESVDQRDPITGLYPFMIASMDRNLSVGTVFCLLRLSPSRCPDLLSTVTM
eukprot:CAMPEP_0172376704 /NCGR_PEP_ID=MMETSP1060-20121228/68488_1 /TAXON_ID=37318 /ORGANISM="Pseudo-nitzschia pungens, Strain cf. cingulata" /LENGTH=691 /DNA_ID=CAMNT_0013104359 /DNA_START=161 /DNA_END=2236 /DNA_ORIENTATION=+